jgi:hypothetical protein
VRTLGDEFNNESFTILLSYDQTFTPGTNNHFLKISDGTNNNRVGIFLNSGGEILFYSEINGAYTPRSTGLSGKTSGKIALAVSSGSVRLVTDDALTVFTSGYTGPPPPGLNRVDLGQFSSTSSPKLNGTIKGFKIFPTALSDAELITLTGG